MKRRFDGCDRDAYLDNLQLGINNLGILLLGAAVFTVPLFFLFPAFPPSAVSHVTGQMKYLKHVLL